VACLIILGYQLTKRFTNYTHAVFGACVGLRRRWAPGGRDDRQPALAPAVAAGRGGLGWSSAFDLITPRRTSSSTGKRSFTPSRAVRRGRRAAISPRGIS